jgi:hypothetical protein
MRTWIGSLSISIVAALSMVSVASAQLHSPVSIISLIASPERFVGYRVAVTGYHHGDPIPALLYLSRDDGLLDNAPNSVVIHKTIDGRRYGELKSCLNQWVTVIGTFKSLEFGGHGITDIFRVVALGEPGVSRDSRICYSATPLEK